MARRLSLLSFVMMTAVSAVVFFTEDRLDATAYILIVGAPFAIAAIAYFVGKS